jgi:hypothetical protein
MCVKTSAARHPKDADTPEQHNFPTRRVPLASRTSLMHRRSMPNGALLTSPEVAALLGCSIRTVHRLVTSEDLIPAQKLPGPNGAFLFDRNVVEMYRRQRAAA